MTHDPAAMASTAMASSATAPVRSVTRTSTTGLPRLLLGSWLLMLASAPALAIEPLDMEYQAKYLGLQANASMTLTSESANVWKYSLSIGSNGVQLNQSTTFEDVKGVWRPLSGTDSSLLLIKKVNTSATYDWKNGVATWSGDVKPEKAGPVKLQAGDVDALLLNLVIARDVNAGKPLNYRMVDDGRAKQLSYKVAGKESITIGGKTTEATKVVQEDGKKQIILWVVKGVAVPVRILQRKDGDDEIDLQLKSL